MSQIYFYSSEQAILQHWQSALSGSHDIHVFSSSEALLEALLDTESVIVVLDFSELNDQLIAEKMAWLTESRKHRILILTRTPKVAEGIKLLSKGARGYGNAMSHKEKLLAAVEVLNQGDVWLGGSLADPLSQVSINASALDSSVVQEQTDQPEQRSMAKLIKDFDLTDREYSVIEQLAKGQGNQQIAEKLYISERTVKGHLTSIFRKTGARNRIELSFLISSYL